MKYLALLAAVITAVLVGATTAKAQSSSYTCTYRMNSFPVYITISGRDNMPYFCSIFIRSAGTATYHRVARESVYAIESCAYEGNNIDISVRVSAVHAWQGKVTCLMIGKVKGFTQY
jgi:riboflavin biosynthesis pyrimidine reductase